MALQYKINYTGNSKIIKRIVDKLNNLAPLGIQHDEAFFGDWGNEAYEHSKLQEGNPHNVTLEELGIEDLPRQMAMVLESIGAIDYWGTHEEEEGEPVYIADHDGDYIVFRSSSDLLAWH